MAQLAIKGHPTRGKEVIEILEMMGGINKEEHNGRNNRLWYSMDGCSEISFFTHAFDPNDYIFFTLEEFLKKFPYKVGDKVIIKDKNQEAIVYGVVWCCNTISYWLKNNDFIEGNWRAKRLQPYKDSKSNGRK